MYFYWGTVAHQRHLRSPREKCGNMSVTKRSISSMYPPNIIIWLRLLLFGLHQRVSHFVQGVKLPDSPTNTALVLKRALSVSYYQYLASWPCAPVFLIRNWTHIATHLVVLGLVRTTLFKTVYGSVVSNRIGLKFDRIVLQTPIDGVRFFIWRHTFKMAAMTSACLSCVTWLSRCMRYSSWSV